MLHRAFRRFGSATAASALVTAGLAFAAAPAHAQGVNIDQWLQGGCTYNICLWYHAGQGAGFIGSIVGAFVLLVIYGFVKGKAAS